MTVTDVTSGYAVLGVFGPKARDIVAPLTDADLSNEAFPFGTLQEVDLAYARAIAIRRTYMGELGWELVNIIIPAPMRPAMLVFKKEA